VAICDSTALLNFVICTAPSSAAGIARATTRVAFQDTMDKRFLLAKRAIDWRKWLSANTMWRNPAGPGACLRGSLFVKSLVIPHEMAHVIYTYDGCYFLDTQK
jgi:hypothetical protein